jgi:hypothetical protein
MSETKYFEGRWDCPQCGNANRGSALECEKCHSARPHNVEFYLPDDAREITDEKEIKDAKSGPNWKCLYCTYDNPADAIECVHCGSIRREATKQDLDPTGNLYQTGTSSGRKSGGIVKPLIALGVILLLGFGLWQLFFATRSAKVKVAGFYWERSIGIQKEKPVRESGWQIPTGGRYLSEERKIKRYEKEFSHYEDVIKQVPKKVQSGTERYECGKKNLGNGRFEVKYCTRPKYQTVYENRKEQKAVYNRVPIYDQWYTYEVDKLVHERTVKASGEDKNPRWPDFSLESKEREGSKEQEYIVRFISIGEKKESFTYETDQALWKTFNTGEIYNAEVNGSSIESLEK